MRMVPRKSMRRGFVNNVTFFWYNLSKGMPVIWRKETIFAMFYLIRESLAGCTIPTTEFFHRRLAWVNGRFEALFILALSPNS